MTTSDDAQKNAALNVSISMQHLVASLENVLEEVAGERVGFALVVYTHPHASFVSNCCREDSTRVLRALLDLWDQGMPDIPAHEVDG